MKVSDQDHRFEQQVHISQTLEIRSIIPNTTLKQPSQQWKTATTKTLATKLTWS